MNQNKYILLGIIGNSKGVGGEFNLHNSDNSIKQLPINTLVKIGFSAEFAMPHKLDWIKKSANRKVYAKIYGIDSREAISELKEQGIFVELELILKSNPDYYSTDDIIGSKVFNISNGEEIGEIIEVWEMPANDVWLLETSDGFLPIPFIDDVVAKYDFVGKRIDINLIDGLLDIMEKKKGLEQ